MISNLVALKKIAEPIISRRTANYDSVAALAAMTDNPFYRNLLEEVDYAEGMQTTLLKCCDSKFVLYVQASKVARSFRYAATLRRDANERVFPTSDKHNGHHVWYSGNVPSFAVARARAVVGLGLHVVTIHSNMPLPVSVHEVLKSDDRVSRLDSRERLGVVVAMWDMDKEVSLV